MNLTSDSLGGQEHRSKTGGARSSRARSTIHKKMRKADREISKLDHAIRVSWVWGTTQKLKTKRDALDLKRKELRALLKAHPHSHC